MTTNIRRQTLILALVVWLAACSNTTTTVTPPPSTTTPAAAISTPTPGPSPTPSATPVPVPTYVDDNGFDDHSIRQISSVPEFFALSRLGVTDMSVVKFVIPDLLSSGDVHWMDSSFFALHDEWYWFRLLNGQPVPAIDVEPVEGNSFDSIDAVYRWAESTPRDELPLDLQWVSSQSVGTRLYSPNFYAEALFNAGRNYGVGSLVHLPAAADGTDHWLIELEYGDDPAPEEVARFFERLAPTLPDEIASNLEWVIRSPEQDAVARDMAAASLPYHDRIVRFSQLVPAGEVAVYNPGIAAGRLLVVDDPSDLARATETDILLVEQVPDWLPPASALISSAPQTPLAHVNLLAQNRGIPNASQGGLLDDAGIRQAARVRAPAVVRATQTGELDVILISDADYDQWRSLLVADPIAVPGVDTSSMPLLFELDDLATDVSDESDIDQLRPVIGGKSAGFLTLLAAEGVTTPESPLAITVRPYLDHLELVEAALAAMLADDDFRSSSRARFLFLEGPDDYGAFATSEGDADFADEIIAAHPPGTPLGDVLAAGGFKGYFRDAPIEPSTLDELMSELEATYGEYAPTQGLRFRSSSSVEDIEGFNGAGLYDSNSGFLDDRDSVEKALKKTWASYWGFEAFEERRQENIDHLSGAMGVLVHARFDDELELNNGVATFTTLPDGPGDRAVAVINVQAGAVSVTNPDPVDGGLPEVIEIHRSASGSLLITRIAQSTLAGDEPVLIDSRATELFAQLESATLLWRDRLNSSLRPAQQVNTVTLDFEFKTMDEGWPARATGDPAPARLVVKQARSLDPGLRDVPAELIELAIPRDILARARSVERVRCRADDGASATTYEVLTDALLAPDVGYAQTPFVLGEPNGSSSGTGCESVSVFATPDHFLFELVDAGIPLDLAG